MATERDSNTYAASAVIWSCGFAAAKIASALELKADALFTFDKHQRGLARALKMKLN